MKENKKGFRKKGERRRNGNIENIINRKVYRLILANAAHATTRRPNELAYERSDMALALEVDPITEHSYHLEGLKIEYKT